jgi:hypothetical protein
MVCEGPMNTIADLVYCNAGVLFGLDWFLFALALLGMIAIFCYYFRIPGKVTLMIAFGVIYAIDLFSGGTYYLRLTLVLIGFGIAYIMIRGLLDLMAAHSG